jgi:hypothetical protein
MSSMPGGQEENGACDRRQLCRSSGRYRPGTAKRTISKASAELTQPASAVIDNGAIALVVLVQRNARALSRSHFDL